MVNLCHQKSCQANLQFFEIPFLYNKITFYLQNNLSNQLFVVFFLAEYKFLLLSLFFYFGLPNKVISSAFLFPIKSPLASAVFCTTLLGVIFAASITVLLQYPFITKFSSKWQKARCFNVFSKFRFCWISHFYKGYPRIIVKFTLSSISSALLTWSVNQTSMKENSVLIVFIIVKECGKIFETKFHVSWWIQSNLECQKLSKNHQANQRYHSKLEQKFKFIVVVFWFEVFPSVINNQIG